MAERYCSANFKSGEELDRALLAAMNAESNAERAEKAAVEVMGAVDGVQNAIDNIPEGGTPIVNDLTTGGTTMALSAEMGKQLKQEVDGLTAADVGARPDDWMPSAADVGALAFYKNIESLGLVKGSETIESIFNALPNPSVLKVSVTSSFNSSIYPKTTGTLKVEKYGSTRAVYEFNDGATHYRGTYFGGDTWSGWKQVADTEYVNTHISNPNLLDNWYFADPINQRGQTEYSGAGYTIDRWKSTGGITVVDADGIEITADSSNRYIRQWLGNPDELRGKLVTVSVMDSDGDVYSATGTIPEVATTSQTSICNILFKNGGVYFQDAGDGTLFVQLRATNSLSQGYKAAKLELGSVQTLAHQDANGNWVLNDPPPNKQQELAKCQRYQVDWHCSPTAASGSSVAIFAPVQSMSSAGVINFVLQAPVPMRAVPALSWSGLRVTKKGTSDPIEIPSGSYCFVVDDLQNIMHIAIATGATGVDTSGDYNLSLANGGYFRLDANL